MNSLATAPAVILIIDNDPFTMTGLAAILDMSGYECHCARGAEAALKAARTLPLDLILCDVNLGGESGIDLCQELREQPGMEDVPLMFMSTGQGPDIVRRTSEAGAAYYLRKPFDPEVLLELVGKALWMPHLVQSRVAAAHADREVKTAVPKSNLRPSALQSLQLPIA
jgi:DNA-binding response OmpR family regulator